MDWHSQNQWFGDRDDKDNWEATIYARHIHDSLVSEGYELDSDDYYGALDSRLKKLILKLSADRLLANSPKMDSDPPCKESLPPLEGGHKHEAAGTVVLNFRRANWNVSSDSNRTT